MSTRPRIEFNEDLICNACQWRDEKLQLDWRVREEELIRILKDYSFNKSFDCVVPVSGGKDGSYIAHTLRTKYKKNPLCITVNPHLATSLGQENLKNFAKSGFDLIEINPHYETLRQLNLIGFKELGFPYYGWLIAIQTAVIRLAVSMNIPLIFYGEASEVEWFEIDPCFVFHTFNAFETSTGQVILEGCRLESLNVQEFTSAESAPTPWGWTIDLTNKRTQEGPILDLGMDFPKIDTRRQGRRNRISYGLHLVGSTPDYPAHATGIVKHDRDSGKTEIWHQGEAIQPDEAIFVPALNAEAEDEGWLLSVVYNRATDKSEVIVVDAMNISAGPIARVLLPRRVPFGFHGMWVPQESA